MNDPKLEGANSNGLVTVGGWNACYNGGDNVLALSSTVTTVDASATISGLGLILNDSEGTAIASLYTEFSGGTESITPALNVPPNVLVVGDSVLAVATGEVQGQHFFFEQKLTIGNC